MAKKGPRSSALIAVAAYFSTITNLTAIKGWPSFSPAEKACIGNGKGLAAVVYISEDKVYTAPKLIGAVDDVGAFQVQTWRIGWLKITARLDVFAATTTDRDKFEALIEDLAAPDIPTGSVGVSLVSSDYYDRPLDLTIGDGAIEDGANTSARSEYRLAFELEISTDLVKVKRGQGTAKQLSTTATVTTTERGVDVVESKTVTP